MSEEWCVLYNPGSTLKPFHIERASRFKKSPPANNAYYLVRDNMSLRAALNFVDSRLQETKPKSTKKRRNISLKTRFLIMRRDKFRCQLCGNGISDGAILEIDHKIPISKGGDNRINNLWTLCFDCNRGKGTHSL